MEMKEKTLFKLALVTSLIGIFMLFFISENVKIKSIPISEINPSMLEEKVKIEGQVERITESNVISILNVRDETSSIKVIAYNNMTLRKNDFIEVTGRVTSYKNELEIEADNIVIK